MLKSRPSNLETWLDMYGLCFLHLPRSRNAAPVRWSSRLCKTYMCTTILKGDTSCISFLFQGNNAGSCALQVRCQVHPVLLHMREAAPGRLNTGVEGGGFACGFRTADIICPQVGSLAHLLVPGHLDREIIDDYRSFTMLGVALCMYVW